jgi:CubicO group peptidase (beta-lactamase class C family)
LPRSQTFGGDQVTKISSGKGLSQERLSHLKSVIQDDIREHRYYGAVIAVARHGSIGLFESLGSADSEGRRALNRNSVFSLFSVTKAFTNALVFRAIERGSLALTTKVSAIIPEFSGGLREHITFYH